MKYVRAIYNYIVSLLGGKDSDPDADKPVDRKPTRSNDDIARRL